MIELVEYIAKSLVEDSNSVKVSASEDEQSINILLEIKKEDMGKIIGRQGKIARSIRSILKAVSLKEEKRVNLEIEELR